MRIFSIRMIYYYMNETLILKCTHQYSMISIFNKISFNAKNIINGITFNMYSVYTWSNNLLVGKIHFNPTIYNTNCWITSKSNLT